MHREKSCHGMQALLTAALYGKLKFEISLNKQYGACLKSYVSPVHYSWTCETEMQLPPPLRFTHDTKGKCTSYQPVLGRTSSETQVPGATSTCA